MRKVFFFVLLLALLARAEETTTSEEETTSEETTPTEEGESTQHNHLDWDVVHQKYQNYNETWTDFQRIALGFMIGYELKDIASEVHNCVFDAQDSGFMFYKMVLELDYNVTTIEEFILL